MQFFPLKDGSQLARGKNWGFGNLVHIARQRLKMSHFLFRLSHLKLFEESSRKLIFGADAIQVSRKGEMGIFYGSKKY